jgi:hypothetical protein
VGGLRREIWAVREVWPDRVVIIISCSGLTRGNYNKTILSNQGGRDEGNN